MKNCRKKLIHMLVAIIIMLTSCTTGDLSDSTTEVGINTEIGSMAETEPEVIFTTEKKVVYNVNMPGYEKIRFGETQDVLLLDVEWHTPESFEVAEWAAYEEVENPMSLERAEENINRFKDFIKNKEAYIAKTINGKDSYGLMMTNLPLSQNPHNNRNSEDSLAESQIDPDGYYIYNMYPFETHVWYRDENGEGKIKYFNAYDEYAFYFMVDELTSYCDGLLARGLITQEEYDNHVIDSPLDYFVRVLGLFGVEELKNYPPNDNLFPPAPELIKGKNDFKVLFVGNSLTYTGPLPDHLEVLAKMYGVTIDHTSITNPGNLTKNTKDKAIQSIQENKYDYVIYQADAAFPSDHLEEYRRDVESFSEEAKKAGSILVIYNPAAIMNQTDYSSEYEVRRNFQTRLTRFCEVAAALNGAVIVNAAEAWVYAYDRHPDLDLYVSRTDSHANDAGAYLTACVFASALFDLHVRDVSLYNLYQGDDAIRLGQAAWEYVQYYNEHKAFPAEAVVVADGTNERITPD